MNYKKVSEVSKVSKAFGTFPPFDTSYKGFTLIELLVVIAIIGILSTLGFANYNAARERARDARRKSDLKQIQTALQLYYNDKKAYPVGSGGQISGCPAEGTVALCGWGTGSFRDRDGGTTYLPKVPADPKSPTFFYYYAGTLIDYRLYAHLENASDPDINTAITASCGTGITCSYEVSSPDLGPTR